MKRAVYRDFYTGKPYEVEYDPEALCVMCEQPVTEASVGGINICSWCDRGVNRDGTVWTGEQFLAITARMEEKWNQEHNR